MLKQSKRNRNGKKKPEDYNARRICLTLYAGEEDFGKFVENVNKLLDENVLTKAFVGREVCPTTESVHLQCYFGTFDQHRWTWWKERLLTRCGIEIGSPIVGMPGKASLVSCHTEAAFGTADDNHTYCTKDGDVLVDVKERRKLKQGERTDLQFLVAKFRVRDFSCLKDVLEFEGGRLTWWAAQYRPFIQELSHIYRDTDQTRGVELLTELRSWQHELLVLCTKDPTQAPYDRAINIVLDERGGAGKSFISRWLERIAAECFGVCIKVQVLRPGRLADMAHVLESDNNVVIIDVPRSRSEVMQWNFLEMVKDGNVFSPKYNSTVKLLDPTHVIVLCNRFDNRDENGHDIFSEDRLNIIDPHRNDGMSMVELPRAQPVLLVEDVDPPEPPTSGPEFSSDEAGDGPTVHSKSDIRGHFDVTNVTPPAASLNLGWDGLCGRSDDPCAYIPRHRNAVPADIHPAERELLLPLNKFSEYKVRGWCRYPFPSDFRTSEQFCMRRGQYVRGNWYVMLPPKFGKPGEWIEMQRTGINQGQMGDVLESTRAWRWYLPKRFKPVLVEVVYEAVDFSPVYGYRSGFDHSSIPAGTDPPPRGPLHPGETESQRQERVNTLLEEEYGYDGEKGVNGPYGSDEPPYQWSGKKPPTGKF